MTDHIVSFSVGIDDDGIRKNVEDLATKQIINEIKQGIINNVFSVRRYGAQATTMDYSGNLKLASEAELAEMSKQIILDTISEYKEEIISRAAEMLADSYKRTKVWKEATAEVLNE